MGEVLSRCTSADYVDSQTPTFNATPVVEAALEACRRGVLVEIYADLGFNDEVGLLLKVNAPTALACGVKGLCSSVCETSYIELIKDDRASYCRIKAVRTRWSSRT